MKYVYNSFTHNVSTVLGFGRNFKYVKFYEYSASLTHSYVRIKARYFVTIN